MAAQEIPPQEIRTPLMASEFMKAYREWKKQGRPKKGEKSVWHKKRVRLRSKETYSLCSTERHKCIT